MLISKEDIQNIAEGVKTRYCHNNFIGMCRSLSAEVKKGIEDKYNITATVREFAMGESRITHFAVIIPANKYKNSETEGEYLLIDPTISQFSLENWQQGLVKVGLAKESKLPNVGIYEAGCYERVHWYHKRNDPRSGVDVFSDKQWDGDVSHIDPIEYNQSN